MKVKLGWIAVNKLSPRHWTLGGHNGARVYVSENMAIASQINNWDKRSKEEKYASVRDMYHIIEIEVDLPEEKVDV